MVRDDDERPAVHQAIPKHGQRALESRELVIHRDSHRLEETSEVARTSLRPQCATNRSDQIVARLERTILPPSHNFARQPKRASLVRILAEDESQFTFVRSREKLAGIPQRAYAHPHVQRRARAERESALRIVELMGRDAQVQQDAVEALILQRSETIEIRIVGEHRAKSSCARELPQSALGDSDRLGVAVDADNTRSKFQQRLRVAAPAKGAVEHLTGVVEELHDLVRQNGRMKRALVRGNDCHGTGHTNYWR